MPELLRHWTVGARSALLTIGAVAGSLCLLATVIAPLVGVRPLIFLSGSMSPTIPAGSLALARTVDASSIDVGDIVTVPSNGSFVTHRVVEVTHAPGRATMLLRGDGNKVDDDNVYEVASAPRTEIWVPHAGTVIAWFSRAPGVYVLAGWVALVLGSLRRHAGGPPQRPSSPSRIGPPKLLLATKRQLDAGRRARLARTAAVGVAVVAAPLAAPSPAVAAWADGVTVTGTSISTVTPTAPIASCTTVSSSGITVSWTARPAATGYRITYGGIGQQVTTDVSAATLSRTFSAPADGRFTVRALYGGTWISPVSNELRYDTMGQGNCN